MPDRTNQRIQRITRTGTFVMKWGGLGTGPGEFNGPVGVAADASGHVYVTDHGNNRVQKFRVSNTGSVWEARHLATWGGPGSGEGQFNGPFGITVDATGNLWVADGYNHRLQRFEADGRFLGSMGSFGTGPGSFVTPTWVTFDASGSYYVTETNSDPSNAAAPDLAQQRIQIHAYGFLPATSSWRKAGNGSMAPPCGRRVRGWVPLHCRRGARMRPW